MDGNDAPYFGKLCAAIANGCGVARRGRGYTGPVMKPRILTTEPTESEIQHAAFLLWEEQGRPADRDLEIWLAAKERLKHSLHLHPADAQRAKNAHLLPRTQRAAIAGVR